MIITTTMMIATLAPNATMAQSTNDYQAAWEQLTRLAGTWDSYRVGREDSQRTISYHVTASGSVVFEEFLGDTPEGVREMATAYHLDVEDLVATHYCAAGNQPRMRAVRYDPETRVLRFDFWDVTHLADPDAYYTTNIELHFEDDNNVELRFRGTEAGVQGDWTLRRLRRLTTRPIWYSASPPCAVKQQTCVVSRLLTPYLSPGQENPETKEGTPACRAGASLERDWFGRPTLLVLGSMR
jgi:hypothetical protein